MPKDEVNWNSDCMKHGIKGCAVACHRKRKLALSTCHFLTHRTLYSKEGSTPTDSLEENVLDLMMCAWLQQ